MALPEVRIGEQGLRTGKGADGSLLGKSPPQLRLVQPSKVLEYHPKDHLYTDPIIRELRLAGAVLLGGRAFDVPEAGVTQIQIFARPAGLRIESQEGRVHENGKTGSEIVFEYTKKTNPGCPDLRKDPYAMMVVSGAEKIVRWVDYSLKKQHEGGDRRVIFVAAAGGNDPYRIESYPIPTRNDLLSVPIPEL